MCSVEPSSLGNGLCWLSGIFQPPAEKRRGGSLLISFSKLTSFAGPLPELLSPRAWSQLSRLRKQAVTHQKSSLLFAGPKERKHMGEMGAFLQGAKAQYFLSPWSLAHGDGDTRRDGV